MKWVAVATLIKPRGNRGELLALPLSSRPERFEQLRSATLVGEGVERPAAIDESWWHDGKLVLKFTGVDSISEAEPLAGLDVCVPFTERPALEDGEFYYDDLIGCEVIDAQSDQKLGVVTAWVDGGGTGLLEVDRDWLLPFARALLVGIDVAAKRIRVNLPEGLKDLNRS